MMGFDLKGNEVGDNRPARYMETAVDARDGEVETVVYRASSLGTCIRAFVAMANGYPMALPPDWLRQAYDEGTHFEDTIRQMWAEKNDSEIVDDQREVELDLGEMYGRRVIVRGHIDGEEVEGWKDDVQIVLFEAKKFRESGWGKFLRQGIEVNVNYPWQVSVYMHALGCAETNFVGGKLVEDADGEKRITEVYRHRITQPPISLAAIRKRIAHIEKLIDTGFDAREVECDRSTYPCPAFKLHDWEDDDEVFTFPSDDTAANEAIKAYVEAHQAAAANKKIADALDKQKRAAAERLREVIADHGAQAAAASKFEGAGFTFTRTRKHIPEHTRKASDQDYFTAVKEDK